MGHINTRLEIYQRLGDNNLTTLNIGVPLEGFAEFSRTVAAEGAVLLKNDGHVLPLQSGDHIAIFGRTQINYYRSGTGSGGSVHVSYTTNLLDGLRSKTNITVNETLAAIYEQWIEHNPFDNGGGAWAAEPWHQKEMPVTDELVAKTREQSNKAIIVIGRTAGEDQDNANEPGSYRLTAEEQELLRTVTKYFQNTIVVLNVSNIIDMSWVDDLAFTHPIPSIIYAWHGGMEGGNAIADVLAGGVTPSGKLTDTIAYSIDDYPSTRNYGDELNNVYEEDIYVGYRYFETFCPEKVQYEFGFGLSYTEFNIKPDGAKLITNEHGPQIELQVTVTNTGAHYAGKEVVQVYYEAPQGKLGQPARSLAAFNKTNILNPGDTQQLTLSFPIHAMASYDDGGVTGYPFAYVLEAGTYKLYVGNSVRNTVTINVENEQGYTVESTVVVQQLEQALAPVESFSRMKPGARKEDGTYELAYEVAPLNQVSMAERVKSNLPEAIKRTGDQGYTLQDVHNNKVSIEQFIAQLSDQDLATLVRGEGMSSPLVTPGTASAFGGVSDSLLKFGIPAACTADGPSGIRMDSGHKATQVPIGTLLAATWNLPLIEQLYVMEGKELTRNGIDTLLGPGLNIRRSPLNGRNFEYFSEDPFITGLFAAACTLGVREGGAYATLKHFACNNQEQFRTKVNATVSERALREIYLKGFELAVKLGDAKSIMTAYNPINGHWSASNYDLNTTILRGEWGFEGIVMTDWWATMNDPIDGGPASKANTAAMIRAQNDLYMVVSNYGAEINAAEDNTLEALSDGSLTLGELQRNVINICRFIMQAPVFFREYKIEETIPEFHANPALSPSQAQKLSEGVQIQPDPNNPVFIHVENSGPYWIIVNLTSPGSNVAQTACNLMLNGQLMATVQTNGTDSKPVRQRLVKIQLEPGLYELRLDFTKPGLQIDWIEFREV